jgi:hypothetical protein
MNCEKRAWVAFIDALKNSLAAIQARPHTFAIVENYRGRRKVRGDRLQGFPYIVVYQAIDDDIVIAAVAHTSRRANYWKSRLD